MSAAHRQSLTRHPARVQHRADGITPTQVAKNTSLDRSPASKVKDNPSLIPWMRTQLLRYSTPSFAPDKPQLSNRPADPR
jgi:hypothetical protein